MFKSKSFFKGIMMGVLISSSIFAGVVFSDTAIRVFYNGSKVVVSGDGGKVVSPIKVKGVVYVPLEMIEDVIKKPVVYDAKNNKVDIGMATLANGNIGIKQALTRYGWLTDYTYADDLTTKYEPSVKLPSQKAIFTVATKQQNARDSIHFSGITTLGKDFKRLKAKVAIADWMPKDTTGQLVIKADGKVVFDKGVEWGKSPLLIDLDMKYANEIEFIQEGGIELYNVELTPLWQ